MKSKIIFILFSLFVMSASIFGQTAKSQYTIAKKIPVTGDGFWDYLSMDEESGLLYVSHGTEVAVVNVKEGKMVATITGLNGVHGIAIARDLNKGFISSGRDSVVLVFDLKTNAPLSKIKVTGANPDAILYDAFSHHVFTFNGRSANSTVIDANTLKVVGTIQLDGKPEFSQTTGKGIIYVNIEDKSEIAQINSVTMKVENVWPLTPGEEPSGLALDNVTHRLFSVCGNKTMVILNAENGKVITTLSIGDNTDGVAFDPGTKRAYSSNGDGTMTVVQEENENSFKVLENVVTQRGARTITLDKKTHHIYLPTAEFGTTPEATKENPRPRPTLVPGSFVVLEVVPVN
jgi:DNA-binding beta-propeller fold protein YncE